MPISHVENIDCNIAMRAFPDRFFDLAIVDPPYGITATEKRGEGGRFNTVSKIGSRIDISGKMNAWNNQKPDSEYFEELFRVSKYQIIWGANNFILPPSEYFIIWDKKQTVNNFASAEYAWTNVKMPAKVFRYGIHAHNQNKGDKIHPTQKPVNLYEWLLKNYAKPSYKILDTHLGSGSSRIAALNFNCDFWGYEIDEQYFLKQEERFKKGNESTMFVDIPKPTNLFDL